MGHKVRPDERNALGLISRSKKRRRSKDISISSPKGQTHKRSKGHIREEDINGGRKPGRTTIDVHHITKDEDEKRITRIKTRDNEEVGQRSKHLHIPLRSDSNTSRTRSAHNATI